MGLKLKWQIFWILFLPMSLVISVMSYFNINILENTLVSNTTQVTAATAEFITQWSRRILFLEREPPTETLAVTDNQRRSLDAYLDGFEDIRAVKIYDSDGKILFRYGIKDDEIGLRNALLKEASRTESPSSHLWAYHDGSDLIGEPATHVAIFDNRSFSFEYFMPVIRKDMPVGVLYLSFNVKKLPTLLKLITIGNITLVLIFLISTFIAISIWTDNAVRRPLEFILQAQDRLASGDFDTRVDLDLVHTNELARAYGSFNKMAGDLKKFREELERQNRRLFDLNERYRQLNEKLEQQVQDKTKELREFFSLVTHDLKVPLAAAQGYTELLLKSKTGPLTEKQEKFLRSIAMANSQLLHLVRNMLDSVKYDAGKISYYMENFKLSMLIEEIKSTLQLFLEERDVSLEVKVPPSCEMVHADRAKIGQVLTNLIGNAIEVSKPGDAITLTAEESGPVIRIIVADRGAGIEIRHITSIFNKFTQFTFGEKSSGGMGLGLYIVKKIIDGHSQRILVESEVGKGTIFAFTISRENTASAEESGPGEAPAAAAPPGEHTITQPGDS
ncbi:MAG: HAMP domain-containing sensor histidine kinase [Candidatus Eremiobacteraeota bacterium]|nr:HAMP domain-containing sensor histidine kinase [Candidatus Eremiobacteraeota bacterium]